MSWPGPCDSWTVLHKNSFYKNLIYFDVCIENFGDSAIVEHSHRYGAIFWDVWMVKSLISALKGPDNQWFNTNTKAEIEYLFTQ